MRAALAEFAAILDDVLAGFFYGLLGFGLVAVFFVILPAMGVGR